MILFKKWAKHKVKSYIYCVNQFLPEKRHKKWNQECKQKTVSFFDFCNIFDLLTSSTQKIAWWPPVSIVPNLAYNKNKLYKTLDYWSRDILNFEFFEQCLGIVSPSHFVYDFSRKMFLCYILSIDQISLPDWLSFFRHWEICLLQLFVNQVATP